MNKSGLWKGVVHNRIGHFKFINVEILNDRVPRRGEPERGKWGQRYRQKPGSVQELLQRMNLQVEREKERERASESNISPRLEQTDSHLHGVECKVENLLLYISLFGVPIALAFPVIPSLASSRTIVSSFPAYTLYNLQVSQTVTRSFLFDSAFLFVSFFDSISLSLSLPCSFLSSPAIRTSWYFPYLLLVIYFLSDLPPTFAIYGISRNCIVYLFTLKIKLLKLFLYNYFYIKIYRRLWN